MVTLGGISSVAVNLFYAHRFTMYKNDTWNILPNFIKFCHFLRPPQSPLYLRVCSPSLIIILRVFLFEGYSKKGMECREVVIRPEQLIYLTC